MKTDLSRKAILGPALLASLLLLGCGDPVQRNIKRLEGTEEDREEAKMELTMAKRDAIEPLMRALADSSKPPRVRVDVAELLFRLYLREDDPRVFEALVRALADADPKVRAGVSTALGDMGRDEAIVPLVEALDGEQHEDVTYEILVALETLGMRGRGRRRLTIYDKLPEGGVERFVGILKHRLRSGNQKVHWKAREWLENFAEDIARDADQFVLKGDLQNAEKRYFDARDLVPDSKNINQKLGRFYYDSGNKQKGLETLTEHGMVAHARRLSPPPVIDGVLDDPCWKEAEVFTQFYQCIFSMAAYPTQGRSEAYVGYTQQSFFVAVKGYEPSTKTMAASLTERDSGVSRDDCTELYLDTNHDYSTYYQIIVNSLGTIFDQAVTSSGRDETWNGKYAVATAVEDTFWTCEIEIPFKELDDARVKKGTVWGFNVARVRIGNASEFGQWVPTYGAAHRPDRFGFLFFD